MATDGDTGIRERLFSFMIIFWAFKMGGALLFIF
jgi:hypothetical protein